MKLDALEDCADGVAPRRRLSGSGSLVWRVGSFGETMPSEGEIEGETVVGELEAEYALYVDFGEDREGAWFPPQLVELVDHSPGAELEGWARENGAGRAR